ncbi:MAG: hypothetical protein H7Y09_02575 [Chitinophagaceae bacterium]|nr:hypothetical protein [Anaerolineae bacterium]
MGSISEKPSRPLGVTLAIFVSVILFSLVPLLQIGQIKLIERHFQQVSQTDIPFDPNNPTEAAASGGSFTGFDDDRILLQTIVGIVFFAIAIFAWLGKPAFMRFVLMGAVMGLSLLTIVLTILPQAEQATEGIGGGSMQALFRALASGQVLMALLVPIYVIWYLNRGPARAFYRGHYVSEPEETRVREQQIAEA